MADDFLGQGEVSDPARRAVAITPHATNALAFTTKAIFVGTAGNITCKVADSDTDVLFKNLANGQILDIRATHVRATGTTAADLVALG